MSEKNGFELVRRPPSAVEKAAPSAKRIISGMVADTLALVKKPSLRIVISDDEPMMLEFYEVVIRSFCKEATFLKFGNAEEALRELLREEPDLLITDMNNGRLNGDEMLPLLARKKVGFPILVISGSWGEEGVRQCAGPELNVFYMSKPIQFEEFRTVFETALKIPRNTASRDEAMSHNTAIDPAELESWFQKGKSCFDSENYAEAVKWFRKAAEQNHIQAQCELGYCYDGGYGVQRDWAEAARWYRMAAEQNYPKAQFGLGSCYNISYDGIPADQAEALQWFRKAAEQNYPKAQFELGLWYNSGMSIRKDYTEAARWYRKAAEQGHAEAQCFLGNCYRDGRGVPQNMVEAARWYLKAAEQGGYVRGVWSDADRLFTQGVCYAGGIDVVKDVKEGEKLIKMAREKWKKNTDEMLASALAGHQ